MVDGFVHLYNSKAMGIFVGMQPDPRGMGLVHGGAVIPAHGRVLTPLKTRYTVSGGEHFYLSIYVYNVDGGDVLQLDPNPRLQATVLLVYA